MKKLFQSFLEYISYFSTLLVLFNLIPTAFIVEAQTTTAPPADKTVIFDMPSFIYVNAPAVNGSVTIVDSPQAGKQLDVIPAVSGGIQPLTFAPSTISFTPSSNKQLTTSITATVASPPVTVSINLLGSAGIDGDYDAPSNMDVEIRSLETMVVSGLPSEVVVGGSPTVTVTFSRLPIKNNTYIEITPTFGSADATFFPSSLKWLSDGSTPLAQSFTFTTTSVTLSPVAVTWTVSGNNTEIFESNVQSSVTHVMISATTTAAPTTTLPGDPLDSALLPKFFCLDSASPTNVFTDGVVTPPEKLTVTNPITSSSNNTFSVVFWARFENALTVSGSYPDFMMLFSDASRTQESGAIILGFYADNLRPWEYLHKFPNGGGSTTTFQLKAWNEIMYSVSPAKEELFVNGSLVYARNVAGGWTESGYYSATAGKYSMIRFGQNSKVGSDVSNISIAHAKLYIGTAFSGADLCSSTTTVPNTTAVSPTTTSSSSCSLITLLSGKSSSSLKFSNPLDWSTSAFTLKFLVRSNTTFVVDDLFVSFSSGGSSSAAISGGIILGYYGSQLSAWKHGTVGPTGSITPQPTEMNEIVFSVGNNGTSVTVFINGSLAYKRTDFGSAGGFHNSQFSHIWFVTKMYQDYGFGATIEDIQLFPGIAINESNTDNDCVNISGATTTAAPAGTTAAGSTTTDAAGTTTTDAAGTTTAAAGTTTTAAGTTTTVAPGSTTAGSTPTPAPTTTITPAPPTSTTEIPAAVSLAPFSTFATIPSDLAEFTAAAAATTTTLAPGQTTTTLAPGETTTTSVPLILLDLSGKENLTEISQILKRSETSSATKFPITVTIRVASPSLGSFITKNEHISLDVQFTLSSDRSTVEFESSNATALALAVEKGIVFSMSPEAAARNLQSNGYYSQLQAQDASGAQDVTTALRLSAFELNNGPQRTVSDVSENEGGNVESGFLVVNVTRGVRFDTPFLVASTKPVFTHPQSLPLETTALEASGFSLPISVRVTCSSNGNCSSKGRIDGAEPILVALYATDGFFVNSTLVKIVPITVPLSINEAVSVSTPRFRPKKQFTFSIPLGLFTSSTTISYTGVRLAPSGALLPTSLLFESPNVLRGSYDKTGILYLELIAEDLFERQTREFAINFTNIAPVCFSSTNINNTLNSSDLTITSSSYIEPIRARHNFERTVVLSSICHDPDSPPDSLKYEVLFHSVPLFLRYAIKPGVFTTAQQTIHLAGTPPDSALNTTFMLDLSATDSFNTTYFQLALVVAPNDPPRRTTLNFSSYLWHPGSSYDEKIIISDYFVDPNNDPLTVTATASEYASSFVSTAVDDSSGNLVLIISAKVPEENAGASDNAKESDDEIYITVTDPFGNSTSGVVKVYIRFTLWQKIKTVVFILVGLASGAFTIISYILLYHIILNMWKTKRVTIDPSPINAKNPRWTAPKESVSVQVQVRVVPSGLTRPFYECSRYFGEYIYDELTLMDPVLGEPPAWLNLEDNTLELTPRRIEGTNFVDPNCVYDSVWCRCFNHSHILIQRFEIIYERDVITDWLFTSSADTGVNNSNNNNNNNNSTIEIESEMQQLKKQNSEITRDNQGIKLELEQKNEEIKYLTAGQASLKQLMQNLLDGKSSSSSMNQLGDGGEISSAQSKNAARDNLSSLLNSSYASSSSRTSAVAPPTNGSSALLTNQPSRTFQAFEGASKEFDLDLDL